MIGKKNGKRQKRQPMALASGEPRRKGGVGGLRRVLKKAVFLVPILLLAGAVWTCLQAHRLFTEGDSFRLQALEVEGLRVLKGRDILEASGLQVGDNIFAVDLEAVEERIEELAWVKRALVRRQPPDRLAIDIVERRRVAWIDLGEIYGVDAGGVLLPGEPMVRESYRDLDLPVIGGLQCAVDSLHLGAVVPDSTLLLLLDWWQQASAADAEFCMNVSEIKYLAPDGLQLRLVGDGLEVRLPADRASQRIQVLKRLIKRVYRECPDPAYIDMRFAGQVVVGSKESRS